MKPKLNIETHEGNTAKVTKHSPFQKFKDPKVKKSLKRLNKQHQTNTKASYTQLLAKSIKRRAIQNKSPVNAKRKLHFTNGKQRKQSQQQLPWPKFCAVSEMKLLPDAACSTKVRRGAQKMDELIEEIDSSEDDDCIVLEPNVTLVNIDDEENSSESEQDVNDDIPTTSGFVIDTRRQPLLSWDSQQGRSNNDLFYDAKSTPVKPNDDSCIIIEDSFEVSKRDCSPEKNTDQHIKIHKIQSQSPPKSKESQESNESIDDSVILIDDTVIGDDFIKLPRIEKTPISFKQYITNLSYTSTERKKLAAYNSNTYNPGTNSNVESQITHKRPIIIDGSNVAFGHGRSNAFSAEGIKYCLEYFQKMGHHAKAVIPLFRRNQYKSTNPELLDQLHREGKIVFTPCKSLPNQQSISYDDRFILQLAYELDAAVVSNDNYRDLLLENPAFKKIIENRVIGYSWCDNILILPKDPYGRFGPALSEILRC